MRQGPSSGIAGISSVIVSQSGSIRYEPNGSPVSAIVTCPAFSTNSLPAGFVAGRFVKSSHQRPSIASVIVHCPMLTCGPIVSDSPAR